MMSIMYTDYPDFNGIWVSVPKTMELDALKLLNVRFKINGIECTRKRLQDIWRNFG